MKSPIENPEIHTEHAIVTVILGPIRARRAEKMRQFEIIKRDNDKLLRSNIIRPLKLKRQEKAKQWQWALLLKLSPKAYKVIFKKRWQRKANKIVKRVLAISGSSPPTMRP